MNKFGVYMLLDNMDEQTVYISAPSTFAAIEQAMSKVPQGRSVTRLMARVIP